ncbi:zinc finger CCCH domain-containing protein 13-like [Atheta coriaria]|uniref:zinc finger CCCH domain-containing protein 13-like n=1 Tax=Dalotia coriaria TaxID=877792 RepID=UPI0031F38E2E
MSTIYYDAHLNLPAHQHTQSLIERKKQQWAREREELAGLSENVPWGTRDSLQLYDRPNIKTRYVTKYQKETEYIRRDSSYSTSSSTTVPGTPRRRQHSAASINGGGPQQLPPLYKNQHFTYTPDEKSDKEMGGETSGYGSDNAHHTPEHLPRAGGEILRQHQHFPNNRQVLIATNHANNGYESSSSGREDRLKWGDRGVHLGRYWEPPAKEAMADTPGAPGWVKRGLERDTELVVVNNSSPAESPEQDYGDRPGTSSSSNTNRCYIRGQNVPIDTAELAERERRRQVALAHQEAIREQLEEREKRRQEERARLQQEEYEEERRIAREQEIEHQRQQEYERQRQEKEERERKRKEALREAIEIAEKEAKEEKAKQRLMRQNQLNYVDNVEKLDKDSKTRKNQNNERQQQLQEKTETLNALNIEKQNGGDKTQPNVELVKTNDEDKQIVILDREKNASSDSDTSTAPSITIPNHTFPNNITSENLAVLLQNPLAESLQMQNVQFVLIPTLNSVVPFSSLSLSSSSAQTQAMNSSTTRTENRLLTPTQYRNKKMTCDSATQTDFPDYRKELCEKLANIEICYETSRSRKERRSRSEMRHGELMEAQERPKWGVNRPPTRYLKQSEKDPLYQRRKMRQKLRQTKTYDDKRYSSDDSQTGSPRTYRKKRGFWKKDDALYAENIKVYQTEIIPLDSDKDHIYFRAKTQHAQHQCCSCRCYATKDAHTSQRNNSDRVDIMKIETPREYREKLPVCNNNNTEDGVLDKLTSIHNDLMLKDNWEERSVLYSPSRNP